MRILSDKMAGPASHVSDDMLVRHADGELPQHEINRINDHLKYCWSCRTRRDRIEQAISDIVQYQDRQLKPYLPPSAGGRSMFLAQLDQMAARESSEPWWRRALALIRPLSGLGVHPTWARAAIGTFFILTVWMLWLKPPPVSAAEFLKRARSAETQYLTGASRPVVFRKFKIRAAGHTVTRAIYKDRASLRRKEQLDLDATASLTPASSGTVDVAANLRQVQSALEQEFIAANLDWAEPLSVPAYQTWHDGLAQKKVDVTSIREELQLTTSTPEGPIAEASLRVRERDFHPVAESVRMRDNREIEITEIEYRVVPDDRISEVFPAEPATDAMDPAPAPAPAASGFFRSAPSEAELAEAEVQALTALHGIGADLGEPVEIVRTRDHIEARGLADTDERKAQLTAALKGIPNLTFGIRTIAEASSSPDVNGKATHSGGAPRPGPESGSADPSHTAMVAIKLPLQDYLNSYFAAGYARESRLAQSGADPIASIQSDIQHFSRQAITNSERAMAQAWALQRLAKRYTPKELGKLSPKARGALETMIRDEISALRQPLAQNQTLLTPLLASIPRAAGAGTDMRNMAGNLNSGWPDFAHSLFDLVDYADRVTNGLFAGAGFPSGLPASPPGKSPLHIKSTEDHAADLLFLLQFLEKQLPGLESRIADAFLTPME